MTSKAAAAALPQDLFVDTGHPPVAASRPWAAWLGGAISCAMLAAIALEFRSQGLHAIGALLPRSSLFWAVMIAAYCVTPVSEWLIFRRLWGIPVGGLAALMRKRISNELLLGYLGEVQFYAWARRRASLVAAPFGAIKDVAILSALAGNAVTFVMLLAALPLFLSTGLKIDHRTMLGSVAVLVLITAIPLALRKTLFSLQREERHFILLVHVARIVANLAMVAWLWHLLLPAVALHWWFLLATVRQLLTRLPMLPNKDLLFAGTALFLVGKDVEVAEMVAMVSSLTIVLHLGVGAALAAFDLAQP